MMMMELSLYPADLLNEKKSYKGVRRILLQ